MPIQKGLLPSHKEKNRYIAYTIMTDHSFTVDTSKAALHEQLLASLGTFGYADANIHILPDSANSGVIKTNHTSVPQTVTALALVTKLGEKNATIHTHTTSGILAKAKNALKRRNT